MRAGDAADGISLASRKRMNDSSGLVRPENRSRRVVVTALGFTQILGYGTSFYLLAVLAAPIRADTGWELPQIAAGLSIGLLVAGMVAPIVGRMVDRFGGRPVLAFGSLCFASGLAAVGVSTHVVIYYLAWCVVGLGMAAGLYDAVFSALGRWYAQQARPLITTVTLWGGFASTLCWPLSAYLVSAAGWRATCLVFAAMHLLIALPAHLWLMPANGDPAASPAEADGAAEIAGRQTVVGLISASLMLASIIVTLISVHMIPVLEGYGYTAAAAVALGALIGPSQVAGRFAELLMGRRMHPIWSTLLAGVMMAGGTLLLTFRLEFAAIAIVVYAMGAGVSYIVRGTLPLVMFGSDGYATLMGKLVVPSLIAQALTPWAAALALSHWGNGIFFPLLAVLALANVAVVATLLRWR
jgi:predicted MFS family arabinose efflux permease